MAFERANTIQLRPNVWLIDDAGDSTCYLITGSERALLVDTVNGFEDLSEVVRSLTALPVTVVNTHGHCDHIYGNVYFDEAWMHPADFDIAREHFSFVQQHMDEHGLKPCPLKALEIGQVFDLGGVQLEVVDLKGHTPGSIGLLDRDARLLYTGDGLNTHLWMQLDHSLSMETLLDTLLTLKADHGHEFDYILHGHNKDVLDKAALDWMIAGIRRILAGQTEKDLPYQYFGGECRQHPITDTPGQVIVY